jgi:hypothetical protein
MMLFGSVNNIQTMQIYSDAVWSLVKATALPTTTAPGSTIRSLVTVESDRDGHGSNVEKKTTSTERIYTPNQESTKSTKNFFASYKVLHYYVPMG